MPLCSNCGKDNREGSKFCQSCGTPLASQAPAPRAKKSTSEIASGATCGSCGTLNAPGMKFCKMCGSPLESPQGKPAKTACPSCGGETPTGYKFCQHCGTPLTATPPPTQASAQAAPAAPQAAPAPQAASPQAAPAPMEAAAAPPQQPARPGAVSGSPVATGVVPKTVVPTTPPTGPAAPFPQPDQGDMAKTIIDMEAKGVVPPSAPSLAPTPDRASVSGAIQSGAPTPSGGMPAGVVTPESGQSTDKATLGPGARRVTAEDVVQHAKDPLARLVSVNRDGSDGEVHPIVDETVDLGRTQGQLRFQDDPYLSDRHCRFFLKNGEWMVQDLESTNGVYLRVKAPCELEDGDYILLGKQVLRFESLAAGERDLTPAMEHGVLIFGSPLRTPWCRIRQVTVAGISRDLYHLYRSTVVIGREDGDIVFPDDEFMSRRHLRLSATGNRAQVEDLGSSNGTYLRVRGRQGLVPGDMVRIGDQLLRFEKA